VRGLFFFFFAFRLFSFKAGQGTVQWCWQSVTEWVFGGVRAMGSVWFKGWGGGGGGGVVFFRRGGGGDFVGVQIIFVVLANTDTTCNFTKRK